MKTSLKYIFLFLFLSNAVFAQKKTAAIFVNNSSDLDRKDVIIAVDWKSILKAYPQIDTANFVVLNVATKSEVPFQLEHKGQKSIQNLLLQASVKARSTLSFLIQAGKPTHVSSKTFARYVPERKDDFAWENDKIAFRVYGKALEKTSEDAYGIDVWVKRTSKLVINDRYKHNDYHKDHGDGLDYYSVGFTLGAGGMAPYVNDSVRYSGNYRTSKVLDNGPLRSTFQLTYDEKDAAGIKVKVTKTVSIDAGSQLSRIENLYVYSAQHALPVAIGLSTRNESDKKLLLDKNGILGYWEPVHGTDGITGVGAITLNTLNSIVNHSKQVIGITEVKNNVPYVYYAGAAWDKAEEITSKEEWFNYLQKFQKELKSPLKITVK